MNKVLLPVVALVVVIVLACGGLFMFKGNIAASSLEKGLEKLTGLDVEVSGVQVLEAGNRILVENITIMNAKDYFAPILASLSDVQLKCNVQKFMTRQGLFCSYVSAKLDEVHLDRTPNGRINIREIQALTSEDIAGPSPSEKEGVGFLLERLEMKYGSVKLTEATPDGTRKSNVELGTRTEVYGYLSDPRTMIHIPAVKIITALKRGSMGIPRASIQQHIVKTTGRK